MQFLIFFFKFQTLLKVLYPDRKKFSLYDLHFFATQCIVRTGWLKRLLQKIFLNPQIYKPENYNQLDRTHS